MKLVSELRHFCLNLDSSMETATESRRPRRVDVSEKERQLIRQYQRDNGASHREVARWATREFKRPIHKSTISRTLSNRYKAVNNKVFPRGVVGTSR